MEENGMHGNDSCAPHCNGDSPSPEHRPEKEEEIRIGDPPLSKSAGKKLKKLQRYEEKKARQKAMAKQIKERSKEQKRQDWADKLAGLGEEERSNLIQAKVDARKERRAQMLQDRQLTKQKLKNAQQSGQNIVLDLELCELMTSGEISSLMQQIMYCYAANKKSSTPAHIWLTGCRGKIKSRLEKVPGFDNWHVEKEECYYIEALKERKDNLVYLTADSENVVKELDSSKIYIIGGLVDRNRFKGITMQKAEDQGIQTVKLPISEHLRMTSSQVLTVNQVFEILITYLELKDWKKSLMKVIPQRKRSEVDYSDPSNEAKKVTVSNDNSGEETSCTFESTEKEEEVTLQT
ncbi:hypothetical protein SUGI_0276190 [Cryptomeria japonica]|uniref:tRNA (guanine(9)-N1)-methyltransferase n=1 Tax=Cryptomeria japonica TaxID=3369 RepID=UPI002408BA00|nr:tRNA (guanine(9)-N1)-methyltransferase [Cryptomeria japonica]GLJ16333.1 hypothetical protein SUGI_0276190 [Cryptomeria japonica]